MAINRRLDIVYCASFCLLLLTLLAFDLRMSYFQAESEARADVSNSSFLISEWIKGSFDSSDYVLRDIVSRGNELGAPVVDSHAGLKQRRMNLLEAKRKSLPNAFTVALYDQNCIAVHSNTSPRFDASSREYCQVLRSNPAIESMVTHAFFSSLGRLNVVQARRIPGNSPGFHGLALFGIDLGFFSRLVDQVSTRGHGNVVIIDANRVLLARKPHIPEQLGKALDNPALEAFIASNETMRILSIRSGLDGERRLSAVRKVGKLPFIVAVGIADAEWQSRWRLRVQGETIAAVLLCGMAVLVLRSHRMLTERSLKLQIANERLATLSVTDALTGLANRRRFDEVLASEWIRAQRTRQDISLVMIDVDLFKKFNDRYGHPAGDASLREIASVMQGCAQRVSDLVARYGGEEFALILPGTSHAAACHIAETIREKVMLLDIPHESSPEGMVTISIGVAAWTDSSGVDASGLLFAADSALYQAKQLGRNQVCSVLLA